MAEREEWGDFVQLVFNVEGKRKQDKNRKKEYKNVSCFLLLIVALLSEDAAKSKFIQPIKFLINIF